MAATAIELTAVNNVSNAPVSGEFIVVSVLITKDNASDYYFPDRPF